MQYRDYEPKKSTKVYVSNLDPTVQEYDLRRTFEKFGSILDVTVKHKEQISFAFIEFESVEQAEKAIDGTNGKELMNREMKVYFAKGNNERKNFQDRGSRGRPFGDRGGYQGGNYDGPRRDFGDRPKGCFNCGKEGHFAKDCPEPRKPREFDRGERKPFDRGDDRGGYDRRDRNYEGGSRSYGDGYRGDRGGRDREGYRGRDRDQDDDRRGYRGGDRDRRDEGRRGDYSSSRKYEDRGGYKDRRGGYEKPRRRSSSGSSSRSRGDDRKRGRRAPSSKSNSSN